MDYTGYKFERITIVSKNHIKCGYYNCVCDCGVEKSIRIYDLIDGKIKSCGCLRVSNNIERTRHGKCNGSEYNTWFNIKSRCYNKSNNHYYMYGAVGIKMCDRWLNSFDKFYEDMGDKPTPNHSIDRYPNKKGDYEPSNCRWATVTEQNRNRSNNIYKTERKTHRSLACGM